MLIEAGPSLTPEAALTRVADQPALVCLHGGGVGDCLIAWGMRVDGGLGPGAGGREGDPSSQGVRTSGLPNQMHAAWSWDIAGAGAVVQLDYEYPAVAATRWPVQAYARWDAAGACTLVAPDAATLGRMRYDLVRPPLHCPPPRLVDGLIPAWSRDEHLAKVARVLALIAAGDIYQANLALPLTGRLAPGPRRDVGLFLRLIAASPAPGAALLRAPGRPSVISHSPECFLRQRGAQLASEPIKGTRRRVVGAEAATRAELLASAKDRAELAMIVDLVRNDLGRVAQPGSVVVEQPARILDLPYVHHLVARVVARLAPGRGLSDAVAAAFPAGSITGAPKIRAMQVIAELEGRARGAYCGAFGWIGEATADLAVAIRTLSLDGDVVTAHAGGGIVADSDPAGEWDEVEAKLAPIRAALGER